MNEMQIFALILTPCVAAYLIIKGAIAAGRKKSHQLLPPKKYSARTNPICPFDKSDCKPNVHGFMELDGYLNCHECPRYCNGVRATGAMPNLEAAVKATKKVVIAVTGRKITL